MEKWNLISSLKVGQVQAMTLGQLMHYIVSVTWLNCCHTTALNNKSLLQNVTKLRLKWSKNQKLKKTLFFPPTTLKYPPQPPTSTEMKLFFDLLKWVRNLNFQKKLIKKLTQLIFPKIDDNKSCMSANGII